MGVPEQRGLEKLPYPTSMQPVTPHSVGSHFPVAKAGNHIAAPAPCSRELEEAGEAW